MTTKRVPLGSLSSPKIPQSTSKIDGNISFDFNIPPTESIRSLYQTSTIEESKPQESILATKMKEMTTNIKTYQLKLHNVDPDISKEDIIKHAEKMGKIFSIEMVEEFDKELNTWRIEFPDINKTSFAFFDTYDTFTLERVKDTSAFLIVHTKLNAKELDKVYRPYGYIHLKKQEVDTITWTISYTKMNSAENAIYFFDGFQLGKTIIRAILV